MLIYECGRVYEITKENYIKYLKEFINGGIASLDKLGKHLGECRDTTYLTDEQAEIQLQQLQTRWR